MTAEFEELVDVTGLTPAERDRLRRVHEMLVEAGPPEELPARLGTPPAEVTAAVVPFPARRRAGAALLIAATVAAACFGGGYLLANQTHSSALHTVRTVELQGIEGQQFSQAALKVGSADSNGNWPMQLTVSGLPRLSGESSRYYLMVWQDGKPRALCGTFEVGSTGSTTLTFSVAYKITKQTRWVVTKMAPGLEYPGHVVMTTA